MYKKEINIIDIDENTNDIFKFTEQVCEGLYISHGEKEVSHNLKTFKIVKTHNTPKGQVGVQYSKKGNFLIISFFIEDGTRAIVTQVMVVKGIKKEYVLDCDNQIIKYFSPQIMDGVDLVNCVTAADFIKLGRFS
jgi:hypothetical protein